MQLYIKWKKSSLLLLSCRLWSEKNTCPCGYWIMKYEFRLEFRIELVEITSFYVFDRNSWSIKKETAQGLELEGCSSKRHPPQKTNFPFFIKAEHSSFPQFARISSKICSNSFIFITNCSERGWCPINCNDSKSWSRDNQYIF